MLFANLHALGRDTPLSRVHVDFRPSRAAGLATANRGEDRELETALDVRCGCGCVDSLQRRANFAIGQRRMVVAVRLDHRKGAGYRFPGIVDLDVPVSLRPRQRRTNPGPHLARGRRFRRPDGQQATQHVFPPDPVHAAIHQGAGVGFQGNPASLAATPLPLAPLGGLVARHAERGDPMLRRASERIVSPARGNAVLVGLLAGRGQRHVLRRAEPDIAAPAIDHQALHPGPRPRVLHEQIQGVPVRVAPRRGQSREPLDRQSPHWIPPWTFP